MSDVSVITLAPSIGSIMFTLFQILNMFLMGAFIVFVFKIFKLVAKANKALDIWIKKNNCS